MAIKDTERYDKLKKGFCDTLLGTNREGMSELLEHLENAGFFTDPARASYGCAYWGGLLEYSVDVYARMRVKKEQEPLWVKALANVSPETIAIVSLLHAIGRTGQFEQTVVNRKNRDPEYITAVAASSPNKIKTDAEGSFVWEEAKGYRYVDITPFGDGERSVITALRYIRLTDEEIEAIGCHKGFAAPGRTSPISDVFGRNPLALALYEASLEATYVVERDKI